MASHVHRASQDPNPNLDAVAPPFSQVTAVSMSGAYRTDYEKHLGQSREHLSGNAGQSLSPSFVPPAGYWTSREKDCFFHALAVHSRLRPDLIAASIKSKNVLDVCAYIDVLYAAAAAQPLHTSALRSSLEGAMEVSDSWVQYEEEQATALTNLEPGWEREAEDHTRSMILAERFQDQDAYWAWKQQQEDQWEREDTFKQLTNHHLQAMNKLIRNAGVVSHETEPPSAHSPTPTFHHGLIDPVLQNPQSQGHTIPNQGPSRTPEPPPNPETLAHAAPLFPIPDDYQPPSDTFPSDLSPDSRRRLGKRLYMRKKRAQAAGMEADMTAAVLTRGRPKKNRVRVPKPRPKKYKTRKSKLLDQERGEEDESHHDGSREASPLYYMPGGPTKPYKLLSAFQDQGIDASMLTESGFDIFNLSGIGKLTRLFHGAYTDPDEKASTSSISSDTLKLLRDILLDFTSTVAHRAISMREQEIILKRKTKIWHLENEDEITPGNVLDALRLHGLNSQSLLSDLVEDSPAESYDEPDANDDYSGEGLEQQFVENVPIFPPRLSTHRKLVPPFVVPPRRPQDTSLLSTEVDTDELLSELDDEAKLDELDRQRENAYEKQLWKAYKGE